MIRVLIGGIILMAIKVSAYFITRSTAVLTDALESVINIISGSFALFSLYYASKPKDKDHPYGHGKIELLSAGFEGGLIFITGIYIIIKSCYGLFMPVAIKNVDIAIVLSVFAGAGNYIMGKYLVDVGKKHQSIVLIADGKHLMTDTITSVSLVAGLLVIHLTQILWIDSVIAIIFGIHILSTGYLLLKQSITGLLDEADYEKLNMLIDVLQENRKSKWIDIHNLRVLKYGNTLHIDAHITMPWYENLEDTHKEVNNVEQLIKEKLQQEVELFVHTDPCVPDSCSICYIENCKHRKFPFERKIEWTLENLLPNRKHKIDSVPKK